MTINTYILNTQILKDSIISHLDKEVLWRAVPDIRSKAMKPQGERKSMKFRGTIYTDGVGVSVLKQNYDTKKKGGSSSGSQILLKQTNSCALRGWEKKSCWLVLANVY
jgi:hypothetical protein